MSRFARRLGYIAAGLGIYLVAVEVLLRLFLPQQVATIEFAVHPIFALHRAPNMEGRDSWPGIYDYRYTTNSLGMRGSREYERGTPRLAYWPVRRRVRSSE